MIRLGRISVPVTVPRFEYRKPCVSARCVLKSVNCLAWLYHWEHTTGAGRELPGSGVENVVRLGGSPHRKRKTS